MTSLRQRQQWFDDGAAAVEALGLGFPPGVYACPLCLRGFDQAGLDSRELTVEHVPPNSLGGRGLVLACRTCNNRAGTAVDAPLERYEASRRMLTADPLRPVDVEVRIGDVSVRGTLGVGRNVTVDPRRNNPAQAPRLLQAMLEASLSQKTVFIRSDERASRYRAGLGLVRAAYLAAFAVFGYVYILQEGFAEFRYALADPDRLPRFSVPTVTMPNPDQSIHVVEDPAALRGTVIVQVHDQAALLRPWAGPLTGAARHLANAGGRLDVKTTPLPWPRTPMHLLDKAVIAGEIDARPI